MINLKKINKNSFIHDFFLSWLKANSENWSMFLEEIEEEGAQMFSIINNGDSIRAQIRDYLRWALAKQDEMTSVSSVSDDDFQSFLFEIKNRRWNLISHLPDITPVKEGCDGNVNYIKSNIFAIYYSFFEIVRQVEILSRLSDDDLQEYYNTWVAISNCVKRYRENYDSLKVSEAIRDANGKLSYEKKYLIGELRDFIDQLQGWLEDRLFAFDEILIPNQYLSIEDVLKDIDFQYNYLQGKSSCLFITYPSEANILVETVKKRWDDFCVFYEQVSSFHSAPVNHDDDNEMFPIRTHFLLGNIPEMIQSLRSVFASVPAWIYKKGGIQESHFHIAMHTIFKALQLKPFSEVPSNEGRIDLLVKKFEPVYENGNGNGNELIKKEVLYILEFKTSNNEQDNSEAALSQILQNDYGLPYKDEYYRVYGIGLCFSIKDKNIIDNISEATLLYENGKRIFDSEEYNKKVL